MLRQTFQPSPTNHFRHSGKRAALLAAALLMPFGAFANEAQAHTEATADSKTVHTESATPAERAEAPQLNIPNFSPLTPEAQSRDMSLPEANALQPFDTSAGLLTPDWGGNAEGPRKPVELPLGTTIADQRLQRIYDTQLELFAQLAEDPNMSETARDQRAQNIISQYQSLLLDNPEYVYGYIMYGKFLRQVGQRELANKAFVKANSLDPDVPVIKQQIGNYLSEEGDYDLALPYFLAAIRISPDTAVYHYQLGQLLHTYRNMFLTDGKLTAPVLDKQLQDAFANAARLDPSVRIYALRAAESFFDVAEPDWAAALAQWDALEATAVTEQEKQVILLQKCRVLFELDRKEDALNALSGVTEPALQDIKKLLEEAINNPEAASETAPAEQTPAS